MLSPERFEQALRNYDPRLSVRWGSVADCWIIERQCQVTPAVLSALVDGMRKAVVLLANPSVPEARKDMLMKACEEGLSAGNGRRVVIYAATLDNRVINALWETDLQTHGTGLVEKTKNRRDAQIKRDRHNEYDELGRETASVMSWALRTQSTKLHHGEAEGLMAQAFGKPVVKGRQYASAGLVDSTGVALNRPDKKVSITIASK